MFRSTLLLALLFIITACSSNVNKQKLDLINNPVEKKYIEYSNWLFAKDKKDCFIASFPISSSGSFFNRKLNYIILDYNKKTKMVEIGVIGGAKYKQDSFVRLQIDDTSFYLNILKDQAWANDENEIIAKLLNNTELAFLLFSNFSYEDSKVIDKYSLEGFAEAYKALQNNCMS